MSWFRPILSLCSPLRFNSHSLNPHPWDLSSLSRSISLCSSHFLSSSRIKNQNVEEIQEMRPGMKGKRYPGIVQRDVLEENLLDFFHKRGTNIRRHVPKKNPLGTNTPFAKGVVLKTLVKKPKKPNSANRKCVLVRLNKTGKELIAYVPGEGHNLQEHNVVLVRVGNLRDVPGVKIKCVRGKFDLPEVVKKSRQ